MMGKKKKIVIACDSYKGCLTSKEVNEALGGVKSDTLEVVTLEMSDGGDGMLDAFLSALGGERISMHAHDALMRWIDAEYGVVNLAPGKLFPSQEEIPVAIIEIAQTAGLALIEPEQRNPMKATSWGVGEQIMHAYRRGIRHFIVGLGGSATSDCGIGMLKAMDDDWKKIRRDCSFIMASDVTNPLCGPDGAAHVFAPQKGADAKMVEMLDARARKFAEVSRKHFEKEASVEPTQDVDMSEMPGAGAAGGLGYAFLQYFHAEFHSGAGLLLDAVGFEHLVADADLVITGEGHSDKQTLMGKLPERILERVQKAKLLKKVKAREKGQKLDLDGIVSPQLWLIAGGVSDMEILLAVGFDRVIAVTPDDMPLGEAMRPEKAKALLRKLGEDEIRNL